MKATRPVAFVKCQHFKRTTKTDFCEIHKVLEVVVRYSRKTPYRKGELEVWVLSPFTGCVKMSSLWGRKMERNIMYCAWWSQVFRILTVMGQVGEGSDDKSYCVALSHSDRFNPWGGPFKKAADPSTEFWVWGPWVPRWKGMEWGKK